MSRRAVSSLAANPSISRVTSAIRFSSCPRFRKALREGAALSVSGRSIHRQHSGQIKFEDARTLTDRDAAFQAKRTHLADQPGSATD
jgi:hypothetical protein